jgi:hypothetical protein
MAMMTLAAALTVSTAAGAAMAAPGETPEQRAAAEAEAARINAKYGYNGNLLHDLRVWITGARDDTPAR